MNRRNLLIGTGIVLIIGTFFIIRARQNTPTGKDELISVSKQTIVQDVVVTGKTKSSARVDLAFERSGKVSAVLAHTGDHVKAGQLLIQLDAGELAAQYKQAQGALASAEALRGQYEAAVAAQQAKLDELRAGTRPEEITIAETDLQKAQQDLVNYYGDIDNTIADAYQKADDSVRTKTLGMFSGFSGGLYTATYYTCEEQAKNDAQLQRGSAERALEKIKFDSDAIKNASDAASKEAILAHVASELVIVKSFLDVTRASIANPCLQNDTTVATYRSNVNTAITNVVTAQTSVQALQQNIITQKLSVQKLQNQLDLKKAGSVPQQIDAQSATLAQAQANLKSQEAQIQSANANVQLYGAQLAKLSLRTPIDGTVTFLDIKQGELASANATVATVIEPNALEIEAQIPEADIGKIAVGNDVTMTFDALGADQFAAKVIFIDPAETIIDGVVNYKVKISLSTTDERVKSGLTANITIHAQRKENVLSVPEYALIEEDTGTFVQKISANGTAEKTAVTVGMRGTNNLVEILKGLTEGDRVQSVGLK